MINDLVKIYNIDTCKEFKFTHNDNTYCISFIEGDITWRTLLLVCLNKVPVVDTDINYEYVEENKYNIINKIYELVKSNKVVIDENKNIFLKQDDGKLVEMLLCRKDLQ